MTSRWYSLRNLFLGLAVICAATSTFAAEGSSAMIGVEVVLAEFTGPANADWQKSGPADESPTDRLQRLEKLGVVAVVARVRLTTLDNTKATLQLGETTPIATSRSQFGGGNGRGGFSPAATTAFTMQNLGSMITVTPTVGPDGAIQVALEVERSRLIPAPERAEGNAAAEFVPARTSQISTGSVVRVRDGKPQLVAGASINGKDSTAELLVLVSAQVVGMAK